MTEFVCRRESLPLAGPAGSKADDRPFVDTGAQPVDLAGAIVVEQKHEDTVFLELVEQIGNRVAAEIPRIAYRLGNDFDCADIRNLLWNLIRNRELLDRRMRIDIEQFQETLGLLLDFGEDALFFRRRKVEVGAEGDVALANFLSQAGLNCLSS